MDEALSAGASFTSDILARLDRLPWSRWHWRIVVALGITWMLDGLEVTIVGVLGSTLRERDTLGLSESQIGAAASAYLAGAILGALVFGRLTDLFGRRKLFLVTLSVYLCGTFASALSWSFASFALSRAVTGAGIGGEYSAVNAAIDELLPARVRGRADLAINSTFWLGTALGALSSLVLLNPHVLPRAVGWRASFGLGAVLGLSVLALRHALPESPRWLLLHGRVAEARALMARIEQAVAKSSRRPTEAEVAPEPRRLRAVGSVTFGVIARVLFQRHRGRTLLGLALMVAQAFAYNGIFFTYALVLTRYLGFIATGLGAIVAACFALLSRR